MSRIPRPRREVFKRSVLAGAVCGTISGGLFGLVVDPRAAPLGSLFGLVLGTLAGVPIAATIDDAVQRGAGPSVIGASAGILASAIVMLGTWLLFGAPVGWLLAPPVIAACVAGIVIPWAVTQPGGSRAPNTPSCGPRKPRSAARGTS